jgi:outer membrane receptor protein involved in Fe transport
MTASYVRRLPFLWLVVLTLGLVVLGCASTALASPPYAGRPLADVLRELADGGLRIIYNSEIVPPSLRVTSEPTARSGPELLQQLLKPHGLEARAMGGDVYAVVPAATPAEVAKTPAPPPATAAAPLEQIVVASSRYSLSESTPNVMTFLSQAEVESVPRLAEDTLKVVQRLPGAATNGLSGLAHMRGGEENETLVVFDGLPLYEPFHLRMLESPTSVLDPRVIDGLDVSVGGFSAEFGDRMSTVVEAQSVRPETDAHYELGLSLFHTNGLAAHKFADGRGQWLVAARRSNLDEVADLANFDRAEPNYTDAFARVDYELADGTKLALHALASSDSVEIMTSDDTEFASAEYHNRYVWGTLEHEWSKNFEGRALLSYTDVSSDRHGEVDDPGHRLGSAVDLRSYDVLGVRADFTLTTSRWLHRFGAELRSLSANYDYASDATFEAGYPYPDSPAVNVSRRVLQSPQGNHVSAYFTSRTRIADRLTAELGLRWDEQTYVEDADEQFGPRLNLMYDLDDRTQLRASWGRYQQAQGIDELQVEDGIDHFWPAQRADHLIIGLERRLDDDYLLRIEAYRKDYDDLRPRYENLFDPLSLVPELRADRVRIAPDSARAEGVEMLFARRSTEPWNGWLGYSWAEVDDDIDGRDVRRSWDQTHALSAGVTWSKAPWDASLAITYHTGWPTTPVHLADPDGSSPGVVIGERNSDRVSAFASLDFRVARTFPLRIGELTAHVEVTNALNRENPCCVDYSVVQRDSVYVLERDTEHWLPLIPSIGVLWTF